MAGNSSKHVETGNSQVYALEVARDWLHSEGGRARIPTALSGLIEATISAVERGDPPPEKDGASLYEIWRLSRGQSSSGNPPRGPEVENWWQAREGHIRQVCQDRGCTWVPALVIRTGGGRQNPTVYVFDIRPLEPDESTDAKSAVGQSTHPHDLRYRIDPIKPALWLRLLVGSKPFPIKSWRGYVLLGSVGVDIVLIGLMWSVLVLSWSRPRPVTTNDLLNLGLAAVISLFVWRLSRPIRMLPARRVTLANEAFMSLSTLHGQLRTMHDGATRFAGRTFSMVRHWGVCPICAAEVDLAEGGREFPERLIGRCGDAPLEHVFSFDPVRLTGSSLRTDLVGHAQSGTQSTR